MELDQRRPINAAGDSVGACWQFWAMLEAKRQHPPELRQGSQIPFAGPRIWQKSVTIWTTGRPKNFVSCKDVSDTVKLRSTRANQQAASGVPGGQNADAVHQLH